MADIRLSIILVTSGRPTLARTLRSIASQPLELDDEVLVVANDPFSYNMTLSYGPRYRYIEDGPFGNWGQVERQNAMKHATGTHLLFMDDDDFYTVGAFKHIRHAISLHPDMPIMFRMISPYGVMLWVETRVWNGNVSGTQFVVPNNPAKLGTWAVAHDGDFNFITSTLAHYPDLVWANRVIAGCRDFGGPAGG